MPVKASGELSFELDIVDEFGGVVPPEAATVAVPSFNGHVASVEDVVAVI